MRGTGITVAAFASMVSLGAVGAAAQDVHDLLQRVAILRSSSLLDARRRPASPRLKKACMEAQAFVAFLDALSHQRDRESGLRGRVGGGLTNDDVSSPVKGDYGKTTVKSEVELARGSYRNEIELRSSISIELATDPLDSKSPKLKEQVSTLHLSWDRYWHPAVESFAFLHRLADNFLAIDERYEVGGGFNFVLARGGGLSGSWADTLAALVPDSVAGDAATDWRSIFGTPAVEDASFLGPQETWSSCFDELMKLERVAPDERARTIKEVKGVLGRLAEARVEAVEAIVKEHSRWSFSLLAGAFVEVEQYTMKLSASLLDSIAARPEFGLPPLGLPADSVVSRTLDAARGYRWEVRPTLAWKPTNALSLRCDLYGKFPLGEDWRRRRRTDLQVALTWSGSDNVEFKIGYQRRSDASPPDRPIGLFFGNLPARLSEYRYSVPGTHHILATSFGVKF